MNRELQQESEILLTEQRITKPLLVWYVHNQRDLPWRKPDFGSETPDAYHVWVSEIMLQQTRVEAVKPYYTRFLKELPTIHDLAKANEDVLMKLWQGLGYYNRVRNMQKAAVIVDEKYDGQLPADYEAVLALPGIGTYTAGAICSIAFQIPAPAVDGNVLRVISRVLAKDWDIARSDVKQEVERIVRRTMPESEPGAYNQALMELGATVCVPNGIAKCSQCPLENLCLAKKKDLILKLPVKSQKKPRRIAEKTVLLLIHQNRVALHRRPKSGLLAGLYEFPNTEGFLDEKQLLTFLKEQGISALRVKALPDAKHIFTHVEWHMKGYRVQLDDTEPAPGISAAVSGRGSEKNTDFQKEQKASEKAGFYGTWIYADVQQLENVYAIPSAFAAYREYINI